MGNKRLIRIDKEDLDKLRGTCKELFLDQNPEFRTLHLSDTFMLKKVIRFYIEN